MTKPRLKIALVGCGQIADAHLQEIRKIDFAQPVAVCDRHIDLGRQAGARFGVPGVFSDLGTMLEVAKPDVLHITTPPQTHCPIALQALAAGLHVYVEKPFSVDGDEAARMLAAAKHVGRLICVGHDQLYDPAWEAARRCIRSGEMGEIVHVDSVQGYDLRGSFGKALASNPDHWVHYLPGGLFQNVMSHALYRITDLLDDPKPRVLATWFGEVSGARTPTELRVILQGRRMTANLVFSSTMRPVQRLARIHGTRQSIEVDLDGRTIRRYRAPSLPGAFGKLEAPFRQMTESARSFVKALSRFALGRIHYFAGMNKLFRLFYESILTGAASPIPPADVLRVTGLMDDIFHRCRVDQPQRFETRSQDRGGESEGADQLIVQAVAP